MKIYFLFPFAAFITFTIASCSTSTTSHSPSALSAAAESYPQVYQELLDQYVSPKGVRYTVWSQSSEELKKLKGVTQYYANNSAPTNQQEALAWYINAYNAWMIQKIFDHWPNEGPLDASLLFFHKKSIRVAGKRMSFQHLENEIIRKKFDEPRIHFALNCASLSCPPLHDQAFQSKTLDRTLQKLTKDYINNNAFALIEKQNEVQISKIFEWYHEDFGGTENLLNYINQYRNKPLSTQKKVTFQD